MAVANKHKVLSPSNLNIIGLVEDVTPDTATDYLAIYDASAGGNKRVLLDNLGLGGGGNSFTTIQPDSGTAPVADSSSDTLTLTSSDSSLTVEGDSTTDEVDFLVRYSNPNASYANTEIFGASATATAIGATAFGNGATASGGNGTAIGLNSISSASNTTAIGFNADATVAGGTAVGAGATAVQNSTALGINSNATTSAVAIGYLGTASSTLGIAMGYNTNIAGSRAVGIGANSTAGGLNGLSLGYNADSTGANTIVVGADSDAGAYTDAILIGEGLTGTANNELNIGDTIKGDISTGAINLESQAVGSVPLTITGETSQTANLLEIEDDSSTTLMSVSPEGYVEVPLSSNNSTPVLRRIDAPDQGIVMTGTTGNRDTRIYSDSFSYAFTKLGMINYAGQGTYKCNGFGSSSATILGHRSDADTGVYFGGADDVRLSAGGVDSFIGTTTYSSVAKIFGVGQYATGSLPTASSYEGYLAYDTTTDEVKFSDGSAWTALGGGGTEDITFTSSIASTIPLTLQGSTSQTGNLLDFENDSATVLSAVLSDGTISPRIGSSQTDAGIMALGESNLGIAFYQTGSNGQTHILAGSTARYDFTKNGLTSYSADTQPHFKAGSRGANTIPMFSFSNDKDTGFYSEGADDVSFTAGGVQGIGQTSTKGYSALPFELASYATGSLPTASSFEGSIVYDSTTQTIKWSDGTSWATI